MSAQRSRRDAQKTARAAITARELRARVGRTQEQVASAMGWSQSTLARFEQRADHEIPSLLKFVRALGGEVQLIARFRGHDAHFEEATLAELRKQRKMTQQDVAAALGQSQGRVSEFERPKSGRLLSRTARYVAAVGGRLVVRASIAGDDVDLVIPAVH